MGHGPGTRDRGPGPGLGQPSESREEFVGSGTIRLARCARERIVEAPGFAPGSENTSPQESTMRIRF